MLQFKENLKFDLTTFPQVSPLTNEPSYKFDNFSELLQDIRKQFRYPEVHSDATSIE